METDWSKKNGNHTKNVTLKDCFLSKYLQICFNMYNKYSSQNTKCNYIRQI